MTDEQEQIAKIEEELDGARRDLQETLSAVNAKVEREVERVEDTFETFNPVGMLRNNIVGAACVAGVMGFLLGTSKYRRVVFPIAIVAVGYAVFAGLTGAAEQDGSDIHGGESDHS